MLRFVALYQRFKLGLVCSRGVVLPRHYLIDDTINPVALKSKITNRTPCEIGHSATPILFYKLYFFKDTF